MASTRLPGKIMFPFAGKPDLEMMIERVKRASLLDEVVVATTTNPKDDTIATLCRRLQVSHYRGSEEDVLKRLVETGKSVNADIIVETTSDCPVIDWRHIDYLVNLFFSGKYDYVSNIIERSFPRGFDTQVLSLKVLEKVERVAKDHAYREHPTFYIYTHPKEFRLKNWKAEGKMFWPDLRVTLDTKEDYRVLSEIFDHLYPVNPDFSAEDVVDFLRQHPEIVRINSEVTQKNPHKELRRDKKI
ncbi:glycosyltransferase family protein [Candidatus Collierbacteria bacterium]|nr:glycosyltransferase family protein [Candidatus Collierbacteria bacterium]